MRTLLLSLIVASSLTAIAYAKPRKAHRKPEAAEVVEAKGKLKIARAVAKARKAIEACEQAIVDACIDGANEDGSTDCEDNALKAAFEVCHVAEPR